MAAAAGPWMTAPVFPAARPIELPDEDVIPVDQDAIPTERDVTMHDDEDEPTMPSVPVPSFARARFARPPRYVVMSRPRLLLVISAWAAAGAAVGSALAMGIAWSVS